MSFVLLCVKCFNEFKGESGEGSGGGGVSSKIEVPSNINNNHSIITV